MYLLKKEVDKKKQEIENTILQKQMHFLRNPNPKSCSINYSNFAEKKTI